MKENIQFSNMETDFLNFHDEEHFSSALYQNDLLDDSQSSLLDIVGDYRHDEYADNVVWDQDVERELNGDLAVIPMSGQINTFPKLSNSPPSKDFQKIFSDWQHLSSIEATTSDLNSDLHLSNPIDMLDCFQPSTVSPSITIAAEPIVSSKSSPKSSSIISSFDFSNTEIPIKKETKTVRKIGGKNLELLKKVIKEENELGTSFKSDLNSSDELDPSNFDITSYVNGDDDLLIKKEIIDDEHDLEISENNKIEPQEDLFEPEPILNNDKPVKTCKKELFGLKTEITQPEFFDQKEKNEFKKFGGEKTIENIKEEKKIEDPEEDVDVETVTEQIPVLEARDLNSLLEQFEATEAVNPVFDPPIPTNQNAPQIPSPDCKKQITNDPKQKVKQLNSELKQPSKQKTVTVELIQKIRASASIKKIVNVIPARPTKKLKTKVMVDKCKIQKSLNEMIHIDHDYCSPVKSDTNMKKINPPSEKKDEDNKKIIDDTAIRIGKQIKNAINNENLKKPVKNEKVMISLLKTNFNKNNTIINTINTNDEKIQNIIVTENSNCKKRKLNLEEYKKLRGEILKSSESSRQNSPLTSGTNSPLPQAKTVEYQELIMKMASEILKTNAKQTKQPTVETKLEEFIPPEIKIEKTPQPEVSPPKINENYQMKTIVSIGINTNESWIKTKEQKPPKNKIDEIITPILQNTNCKINSNSLIANITETLMQQSPKISPKNSPKINEDPLVHGEDKTVIILNKNEEKPVCRSIAIQTDKICRNYRQRRDSSSSSEDSVKKIPSLRNSSISSYSRSRTKSRTRSRSRSRSRSTSQSEYSSYSSDSSRSKSKSRSVSPRRFSRNRYRSRRRSRSNSYRGTYRHSRSPYSRSRSRRRRERESIERERMREVEERRVIYVGKINDDTTRADLRRRFQNFGPITNVSVHFREHGDNYGFVTFAYKMDAYEAVERGNEDPNLPKYDISFGGRRAFCKTRYSDLDNIEAESMNQAPIFRREEDSFDILLREVQAKLRKRKV